MFANKEIKKFFYLENLVSNKEENIDPLLLVEKIWHKSWEISQVRGNPGRGVKRFFPFLHGGETQRLVEYFKGNYTVTLASKEEWAVAYESVESCMYKEAKVIHRLWEASGVHLFLLKDHNGIIVARCLGKGSKRAPCYGEKSYILATVLRHFAGVDNKYGDWLTPKERKEVGYTDYKSPIEKRIGRLTVLKIRTGYKRVVPYVDGHDKYRPQIYANVEI